MTCPLEPLKPGDRVEYRFSDERWVPATVEKIGRSRRIVVRLDEFASRTRNTVASQLRKLEEAK